MLDWQPLAQVEPFANAIRRLKERPDVIRFCCPKGHEIVVAKRFAGRLVRCTLCRMTVRVPRAAQDTRASEPADSAGPPVQRAAGATGVVVTLIGLAAIAGVSIYLVSRPSPEEKAAKELVRGAEEFARQMERELRELSRSVSPRPPVPQPSVHPSPPTPRQKQEMAAERRRYTPPNKPPPGGAKPWEQEFAAAQAEKWFVLGAQPGGPLPGHNVTALALDGEDLWVGGQMKRKSRTNRTEDPRTGRITVKRYHPKWICRYNTRTSKARIWEDQDGIVASPIDIKVTPEDVWVLSGGKGGLVQRFRKHTRLWMTYDATKQGLKLGWARSLCVTDTQPWTAFDHRSQDPGGFARLDPNTGGWEYFGKEQGLPHLSGCNLASGPAGVFAIAGSGKPGSICRLARDTNRWEVFEPLAEYVPADASLIYQNGCLAWSERDNELCIYDLRKETLRKFPNPGRVRTRVHAFDGRFLWVARRTASILGPRLEESLGRLDTENSYLTGFKWGHNTMEWGVRDIIPADDYVWIATNTKGVVRMKRTDYPSVQSTVPANGADDVSVASEISVTFSHPMRWKQFDSRRWAGFDRMSLWAGLARVQADVRYDPAQRKAILALAGPLDPGVAYELRIRAGVRDIYDEPLPEDHLISFSTEGR
jgi:hypothetical protein